MKTLYKSFFIVSFLLCSTLSYAGNMSVSVSSSSGYKGDYSESEVIIPAGKTATVSVSVSSASSQNFASATGVLVNNADMEIVDATNFNGPLSNSATLVTTEPTAVHLYVDVYSDGSETVSAKASVSW